MMFKKKGSIVEKMVIIVTSRIQGVINDKNGLLVISSYNEGIKSIESVLNDSLLSFIVNDNNTIEDTNNTPIAKDKQNKDCSLLFTLHIILQFRMHFSTSVINGLLMQILQSHWSKSLLSRTGAAAAKRTPIYWKT